jgi:hypothetical protein
MIFRKASPLLLAALSASFMACNETPSSPRAVTTAEARADLQAMADKVRYFAPQTPGAARGAGGGDERGAAKAAAGREADPGCVVEATVTDSWQSDTAGGESLSDTVVSYTSAGRPICDAADEIAYQIAAIHNENAMLESRFRLRLDLPAGPAGEYKTTGSGTVRYKDGYLITVTSMNIVTDSGGKVVKSYVMNLALEKGYTVALQVAPGIDLMGEVAPGPDTVVVGGPIVKDGTVAGYFEVMGDCRVIVRDADKVVIESHG